MLPANRRSSGKSMTPGLGYFRHVLLTAQTARAQGELLWLAIDHDSCRLDVGLPAPTRPLLGVADVMSELR